MFHRMIKTIAMIVCCFFQDAQGHYTREQLENYLGKPISNYRHIVDFVVVDEWLYTTKLSKILLVGDSLLFDFMKEMPAVGSLAGSIFNNSFSDTRFESFIESIGKFSQLELQEAIQDTILLASASTQAYSTHKLLDYLIAALQNKIIIVKAQIEHDFKYDQKSLRSLQKSLAWTVALIAFVAVTNTYCSHDEKKEKKIVSNIEGLNAVACLCILPASYKTLKGCYKVLRTNPNAYNKYVDEFQKLLIFVQELKTELKKNGTIRFKLANGCIATLKVDDTFLGSFESLALDLDN